MDINNNNNPTIITTAIKFIDETKPLYLCDKHLEEIPHFFSPLEYKILEGEYSIPCSICKLKYPPQN